MSYDAEYKKMEHHLSSEARKRLENPMKAAFKVSHGKDNMISLANGDPHPFLYPISQIDYKIPSVDSENPVKNWINAAASGSVSNAQTQTLSSYRDQPCALLLSDALQYGTGAGLVDVRKVLERMNALIHWPSGMDPESTPKETTVTLSLGNADALTKCFRLLGSPGDTFLVEEFSFPGMTNAPLAQDIKWVPVRMDKEGLLPEVLEDILFLWDEKTQGKKPHVLYTIPSGQNPTGGTLSIARRREIYRIASQHDIIILEDEPYYFLKYDKTEDQAKGTFSAQDFLKDYPPTLLSMDMEGRVLRIDTFSKIIFPGMRLGWITSNPMFAYKLEVLTDSSTQHPHGLGQAFVAEMLSGRGWGIEGYLKWIASLCVEYQRRRDLFLDVFQREMGACTYATADTPSGGMFIWIEIHYESHPRYQESNGGSKSQTRSNVELLNDELFQKILEKGVVVMPAKIFAIVGDVEIRDQDPIQNRFNFFRATFVGTDEVIIKGMTTVCREIKAFFDSTA